MPRHLTVASPALLALRGCYYDTMSNLLKLRKLVPAIHDELFAAHRAAEEARPLEQKTAITIQKYGRGFLTRRRIDHMRNIVICIQRVWRGYLGRQRALMSREARDKRLRESFFAAMATTIQRHWRGFWSRKYVFDFRARKLYLERVAQLNTRMRSVLAEEGERAAHAQKALAQESARAAFDEKVGKLHHLLSTQSQPGIFASPYALAAGTVPVIAGAPVEEHLKAAFRNQKSGPQVANSIMHSTSPSRLGTFLPPIKSMANGAADQQQLAAAPTGSGRAGSLGLQVGAASAYPPDVYMGGLDKSVPRNQTLRQVVPYNAIHQAQLLESKVVKAEMMIRHPLPFASSLHKPDAPALPSQTNKNLEGYEDPWDPTIGARTETFTPNQRSISPVRFQKFLTPGPYFDSQLLANADTLPPKTFRTGPVTANAAMKAAGFSSADVRRRAQKPAR